MNLPNKLSTLRICMVPLFIVAYFLPYWWCAPIAVGLFVLAAFTDFLDGHIARKYNMVTDLGKLLDPIADKILVCAALFCIVATDPLSVNTGSFNWSVWGRIILAVGGIVIIARELLISAMRQIAASKGVVVQANMYGKIKTVFQDISLPVLILLNAVNAVDPITVISEYKALYMAGRWLGVILFGIAVILTILSCIIYLVQNKKVFEVR